MTTQITTDVAIVGAGPAGLMVAHLLARAGVSSVAIDIRTRHEIETTQRAGILEADAARLILNSGVSDRILRDGYEHSGTYLRFNGESHHVNFKKLVGESVWLYPQTDVFMDLADARARNGGDVRFGVSLVGVHDIESDQPRVTFTDADGTAYQINAKYVVGADGSRSICRFLIPEDKRVQYFREYPFAWFGIMCEAPMSAPELVYAHSPNGFALISQRTESLQRMYFQCDPEENADEWSDERIWEQLQSCVAGDDGFTLKEGPITEKTVLRFRSFVQEPMRWGRMLLAGDAAHTVPPTGARGLNLALHDAQVLADVLVKTFVRKDDTVLEEYQPRALRRVWRAQNFSYWMTQMLHLAPGGSDFDLRRQLGELDNVVSTTDGRRYLAQQYTGWPAGE